MRLAGLLKRSVIDDALLTLYYRGFWFLFACVVAVTAALSMTQCARLVWEEQSLPHWGGPSLMPALLSDVAVWTGLGLVGISVVVIQGRWLWRYLRPAPATPAEASDGAWPPPPTGTGAEPPAAC